jgi:glycosyltransferase involved in cell wall biosynthesis
MRWQYAPYRCSVLVTDDALRRRMAGLARELMVSRYSWDRHVEALERVLIDVVRNR